MWGILRGKFETLLGKSVIMALKAVAEVTEQVPADDFQALEEKVYRTIEMYKSARESRAAAERDVKRLREQLEERALACEKEHHYGHCHQTAADPRSQ